MTDASRDTARLDALRSDIDAADAEIHRLLIHRGRVIEQLIAAKRLGARASAFRPDREAEMMRRLAARHEGPLPLSTVEHIWREIIGTFTLLQAPFRVHAAHASKPAMRDLLRYYFGFGTPLVEAASNRAAIEAVVRSGTDLAVVAVADPLEERWWAALSSGNDAAEPPAARVIAALPFLPLDIDLDFPDVLVIGSAAISAPRDVYIYAAPAGTDDSHVRILADDTEVALLASPLPPSDFGAGICLGNVARPSTWSQE
jgi:chorismate mutase / prephenate dehydratase